jgi:carbon-monoxide dehydrogenase large subunit
MSLSVEGYGVSFEEAAELVVEGDGRIGVRIGTMSAGQSHQTAYAQIAADALQLAPNRFAVVQGDTATVARGNGTGASRSMTVGGTAVLRAAEALIVEARHVAARLLQRPEAMLRYREGRFEVADSRPASFVTLAEIAAAAGGTLHVSALHRPTLFNFPAGCHAAEVEVDIDTGAVRLLRYRAFQDAGTAINPRVVAGQVQGGVAQGIGAALMEEVRFDPQSGQLLTSSFADYAIPRADDLPNLDVELLGVPCLSNPLGVKAVGEAGPVAAPPAIVNAIVDALSEFGIEHIEMPVTPEKIWRAVGEARRSGRPSR